MKAKKKARWIIIEVIVLILILMYVVLVLLHPSKTFYDGVVLEKNKDGVLVVWVEKNEGNELMYAHPTENTIYVDLRGKKGTAEILEPGQKIKLIENFTEEKAELYPKSIDYTRVMVRGEASIEDMHDGMLALEELQTKKVEIFIVTQDGLMKQTEKTIVFNNQNLLSTWAEKNNIQTHTILIEYTEEGERTTFIEDSNKNESMTNQHVWDEKVTIRMSINIEAANEIKEHPQAEKLLESLARTFWSKGYPYALCDVEIRAEEEVLFSTTLQQQ